MFSERGESMQRRKGEDYFLCGLCSSECCAFGIVAIKIANREFLIQCRLLPFLSLTLFFLDQLTLSIFFFLNSSRRARLLSHWILSYSLASLSVCLAYNDHRPTGCLCNSRRQMQVNTHTFIVNFTMQKSFRSELLCVYSYF